MIYTIARAPTRPILDCAAEDGWGAANQLLVGHFHRQSSSHRPRTRVRALYDDGGIYIEFDVHDRFVRCVHTAYQSRVSADSCVEFFVQPRAGGGYFNFEINCGGAMLLYYIEDPARAADRLFRKFTEVPKQLARLVQITASMPPVVFPEVVDPVRWRVRYFVPYGLFEAFVGPVQPVAGAEWRGNFFKCADESSHPHWASWSPIGEALRFHEPRYFAPVRFAR